MLKNFLKCDIREHGFLRVRCKACHNERLVAFSCKRPGSCPGCGARRMVESAALLVDEILPRLPMRQWVLSIPFQLRFLFASRSETMSRVLGIVYRAIETHLIHQAARTRATARTGAVTLIQRFGSALNLNIHFHMLFLDGVYLIDHEQPVFRRVPAPLSQALEALIQTISQRVGAYLEREGLLVRDIENSCLQLETSAETVTKIHPGSAFRLAVVSVIIPIRFRRAWPPPGGKSSKDATRSAPDRYTGPLTTIPPTSCTPFGGTRPTAAAGRTAMTSKRPVPT